MRRLALALVMLLVGATVRADPPNLSAPANPPPFMPAPPRGPTAGDEREIKRLKREATAFGTVGIVLLAGGIAVDVVALDLPQAERSARQPDGSVIEERYRGDANWAELAGGLALTATGLALATLAYLKVKQIRKLQANE